MQCTACKKTIQREFNFCPYCGNKMNMAGPGCGKTMMADWVTCPYARQLLGSRCAWKYHKKSFRETLK